MLSAKNHLAMVAVNASYIGSGDSQKSVPEFDLLPSNKELFLLLHGSPKQLMEATLFMKRVLQSKASQSPPGYATPLEQLALEAHSKSSRLE